MRNPKFARLIRKINWYPPFLGAGVRVRAHDDDFTRFEVELRDRWWNRNLFGTHFGGALYSMTDPFYVFIVTMYLGRDYVVWDKAAKIDFLKPARGTIQDVFEIPRERLEEIRDDVDARGKNTYWFDTDLVDADGTVVARVHKEVYVRARQAA